MSNSVQPHRQQPTRLPRPWDSPGKNTGVGCHFLLQCNKVKNESEVAQSCPTLRDPMDCSPPGSSVHRIFQARVLEWGAIVFSNKVISCVNPLKSYMTGARRRKIHLYGWAERLVNTYCRYSVHSRGEGGVSNGQRTILCWNFSSCLKYELFLVLLKISPQ